MDNDIIRLADQGKSILYMAHAGRLMGVFGVEDPPKENAVEVIRELKGLGIKKVVMLTGDDPRTAANIAARLGIDEFRAQMLPESKADAVKALRAAGYKVIMVGNGINDTPALTSSDVGVSLRDGTDIAQEVADVVLTANNLADVPKAIRLAQRHDPRADELQGERSVLTRSSLQAVSPMFSRRLPVPCSITAPRSASA
ncbi:MAG: HAD-IC family P-type ATPase [Dakarella massiliensis]